MNFIYAQEKLHSAILSLAETGNRAERVSKAILYNLILITPENDLPDELVEDFEKLMSVLYPDDGRDSLSVINALDEHDLSEAIDSLVVLYGVICQHNKALQR
ncbi:hypothetical protein P3538_01665 [Vibrio parahaemolyticus]|uniref:hypothetical protein n=1 Tax=Vibrio parahaemolyticus TaxID=670 RepID=UPI001122B38C|nr:hypothetical protein [Vibrio parahaemolyticus]MDF4673153.1 hypothetical protein [Vibrio parahaemolyticus]MDF4697403.1 hypothetical protein [Vibrio parahaemolyticus]TOK92541.1 hypothetical protein CGI08_08405 [Vibrio parahaemolyticus]TON12878.1 hypothetical protein CGH63_04470 [Vibrio parahaemolyticus]HCG7651666.1 hypothetical protein [Vibrio parahaemolyticus]